MTTSATATPKTPSRSERGIGARLAKSQDLITLLNGMTPAYVPLNTELTVTNLQTRHTAAETAQGSTVTARQLEKVALNARKKLFGRLGCGMQGRLSDIGKTVLVIYSGDSLEYSAAAAIIEQMRDDCGLGNSGDGGSGGSQSQTSFASVTSAYADLINLVTGFGANYSPTIDDIKVAALNTHLSSVEAANVAAATRSLAARTA